MSIANTSFNRMVLHDLANGIAEKLRHVDVTTAPEMLGDIRAILTNALHEANTALGMKLHHTCEWEFFPPARGEGDDSRCKICGKWR